MYLPPPSGPQLTGPDGTDATDVAPILPPAEATVLWIRPDGPEFGFADETGSVLDALPMTAPLIRVDLATLLAAAPVGPPPVSPVGGTTAWTAMSPLSSSLAPPAAAQYSYLPPPPVAAPIAPVTGPTTVIGGRSQPAYYPDPYAARANDVSMNVSLGLLQSAGHTAIRTQRRLSQSFTLYTIMLCATFVVGLAGMSAAVLNAFVGDGDPATTITFGGLSVATFVTLFVSRPTTAARRLGVQTAWILSIVNTYWTKLAYYNDASTAGADLERAQQELAAAFALFLEHTEPAPAKEKPKE